MRPPGILLASAALGAAFLLAGCASSAGFPDLPEAEDGKPLVKAEAPKRLLACYVVLAWGEMLYTDAFFFRPVRALEDALKLEKAADRVRDWPESEAWGDTEARYATATIAIVLGRATRDRVLDLLARGLSLRTFREFAGEGAVKAAVLEAYVDDIKRQRDDPAMTDAARVDACLARLELVEERVKAVIGLGG